MKPAKPPGLPPERPPEPPAQLCSAAKLRHHAEESLKTRAQPASATQSALETQKLVHVLCY